MNALMLLMISGSRRICPCACVRSEYVLKSLSSSTNVLSIRVIKSLPNISMAKRNAGVLPKKRLTLFTPHAIVASAEIEYVGIGHFSCHVVRVIDLLDLVCCCSIVHGRRC